MKKLLPAIFFLVVFQPASSQIVVASVRANFGVEADLSANFYNNNQTPAVDDWFNNGYFGTGRGVIDTTGAAATVAAYYSNPASRNFSFARRMAYPAFTVLNNRIVLDAVYYRDYHGEDSTVFANGSNKNGMSPAMWTTPVAQSIPDKNDILEAMIHVRRAGPNVTDSLWLFAGVSLENITGNRFFDFELYQTDINYNKATGTFSGYGPDAGHTSWQFDAAGRIRAPGDIIFTSEFSSSAISLVEARIWVHRSMLSITPASFNWGGQFDGDGSGAAYGYANIRPKTAGNFYTGLQTTAPATWAGPFKVVRDNNAVLNNYIPGQYLEFSVNLTKLGIEPVNYNQDACDPAFIRVIVKTRSSTSFTAELKDFVAPFKFFDYPPVKAYSYLTYFCGTMPVTEINVVNPNPNFVYTWTTTNGRIVGSNIGAVITIDAPGTYYVRQSSNVNCVPSSQDSITILFANTCAVLDLSIKNLRVSLAGDQHKLNWTASHNEQAAKYEVEYSTNNKNFISLVSVAPGNAIGTASLELQHLAGLIASEVIFYRIKAIGKNGAYSYSNVAVLRKSSAGRKDALIYPNPSNGALWLSYLSGRAELADIHIFDSYGKVIRRTKIVICSGENLIKLPDLSGNAQGTYLIKIKTAEGYISQKILLLN